MKGLKALLGVIFVVCTEGALAQALPREQARRIDNDLKQLDQQYQIQLADCAKRFLHNGCADNATDQFRERRTQLLDEKQQWMAAYRNLEAEKALSRTAQPTPAQTESQTQARAAKHAARQAALALRLKEREKRREEKLKRPAKLSISRKAS